MSVSPPQQPPGGEPLPPLSPLGLAAVFYGACNLLGPPLLISLPQGMGSDDAAFMLLPIGLGILLAQFGILPAWLVWGERPFWQRLLIHWVLATALMMAWTMGVLMAVSAQGNGPPPKAFEIMAILCLCLPGVSLGMEAPLWATRLLFGWRLRRQDSAGDVPRPLGISDFLWGMAVISASLAALRCAAAVAGGPDASEVWVGAAIAVGSASLASLLVMLPLTWCILRLEAVETGVVFVVVYTLLAGVVILAILLAISGGFGNDALPVAALFLFLASLSASVSAGLRVARRAGDRLQVGRVESHQRPPAG